MFAVLTKILKTIAIYFTGIFLFLSFIIFFIGLFIKDTDSVQPDLELNEIDTAIQDSENMPAALKEIIPDEQKGSVYVQDNGETFTFSDLVRTPENSKYSYLLIWDLGEVDSAFGTAPGLDGLHHFLSSYLTGFIPFKTDKIWVPLYAISEKKIYERDEIYYNGLDEVWQNSRQAYFNQRGDCEDHALILADWLIGLGYDARVVGGIYKEEGHAWVILFKEGKEYLLEATDKNKSQHASYPLAFLETNYKPEYMFNRKYFWINTGSKFTTVYSGKQWVLKSRFEKE